MLARLLARSCYRWAAPSALLAAATSLVPARAEACSWAQLIVEASYPQPEAVAVPTNVVLFVYGPTLASPDSVQLVDDRGELVPVQVQAVVPSGLDVAPLAELSPEQRYVLRTVGPEGSSSVAFTTGSGPATVPESLSAPELDVVQLSYAVGSCGVLGGLCVESSLAANTTLEVRVGQEVLSRGADPAWPLQRAYSQPLADSDCVEVRARDVRGHRSEPRTVCGSDIARFELQGNNFDTAYTCDNYLDYVRVPGAGPEGVTPDEVSPPVLGGNSPVPESGSTPRDVTYFTEHAGAGELTGSDTVIYDDVPSVRSSRGCALASSAPRPSGSAWLGLGVAALALLGARRR